MNRSVLALLISGTLIAAAGCRGGDGGEDRPDAGRAGPDAASGANDDTIQDVHSEDMAEGTEVTLREVVVVAIDTYGGRTGSVHVMEPDGGPYSGVLVFLQGTQAADLSPGDLIDVEGGVKDEFALGADETGRTLTEIGPAEGGDITLTKVGETAVPAPQVVDPRDLAADDAEAEKWEGVLIKFENVLVAKPPQGVSSSDDTLKEMTVTGPFQVSSSLTSLGDNVARDACYASITGLGDYFFTYKILPRSMDDLVGGGDSCPAPENTEALCMDEMDNDDDGLTDCQEPSCRDVRDECTMPVTVVDIQSNADDENPSGDAVLVEGAVVTAVGDDGFYVQDAVEAGSEPAQYNGIYVYGDYNGTLPQGVEVGAVVDVEGAIGAYRFATQIEAPDSGGSLRVEATGDTAEPAALTTAALADLASVEDGEVFEHVLVEIGPVTVPADPDGDGNFEVTDGTTNLPVEPELYEHAAGMGDCYETVAGIMHEHDFDDARKRVLYPRSDGDFAPSQSACDGL